MIDTAFEDLAATVRDLEPTPLENTRVYRLAIDDQDPNREMGAMFPDVFEKTLMQKQSDLHRLTLLIKAPLAEARPHRWNKDFPCFYAALEHDTVMLEVRHHVRKNGLAVAHYILFSCTVDGSVKDVRHLVEDHPELIDDTHHPKCHVIGRVVYDQSLDGLLAPSARRPEGTCVPIFRSDPLQPGEIMERVQFKNPKRRNEDISIRRQRYGKSPRSKKPMAAGSATPMAASATA